MAGGIGSRFWPASTTKHPKQFLDILGTGKTMLRQTYERSLNVSPQENIYIITNEIYKNLVIEQLPEISEEQIILEPIMRNTAPCIAYASCKICKINPNALIVVSPSDHLIIQESKFVETIKTAFKHAMDGEKLITLGIKPSRPDTGYGYIQFNENSDIDGLNKVKTFTEKPTIDLAKTFLQSGDFLWNAGIFIWKASAIMKAFEKYLPETAEVFKEIKPFLNTKKEKENIKSAYAQCTNISIDFGIMEKADNVYVIPSEFGWSDLGTWGSVYELMDKDYVGNAITSGKHIFAYDTSNCLVSIPQEKLLVLQGLHNYIIIDTDDVLMICKKEDEQKIKLIVAEIKSKKGENFI